MRVFKQFLKNMRIPVGISGGYIAASFLSGYAGQMLGFPFWEAFIVGPFTLTLFSFASFLVWVEWDRARKQVKEENNDIMRAFKDE